jgi:hypothetical protein
MYSPPPAPLSAIAKRVEMIQIIGSNLYLTRSVNIFYSNSLLFVKFPLLATAERGKD